MRQSSHILSIARFGNWQLLREDSTIVDRWSVDCEAGRTLIIVRRENSPPLRLQSAIHEDRNTVVELDTACILVSNHIFLSMTHMQKIATGKKKKQVSYEEGKPTHVLVYRRLTLGSLLAICSASRGSFNRTDDIDWKIDENVESFDSRDAREVGSFDWQHGKSLRYFTT